MGGTTPSFGTIKITIVAAGKVTKDNLYSLNQSIHTNEFHGKKIV
jgi:copper homeostasis protein